VGLRTAELCTSNMCMSVNNASLLTLTKHYSQAARVSSTSDDQIAPIASDTLVGVEVVVG